MAFARGYAAWHSTSVEDDVVDVVATDEMYEVWYDVTILQERG
jgi:hypothetical protein